MELKATFAISGPLKGCYGTIRTIDEMTARRYLRHHFPHDWAGIYPARDFDRQIEQYELRQIFDIDLSLQFTEIHKSQKECE